MAAYSRTNLDTDVEDVLPTIQVPTLFIHRSGDRVYDIRGARLMATAVPGAQLIELPGDDHIPVFGDSEAILRGVERFLASHADDATQWEEPDRVLATVLFTDIVGSTAKAAELGDRGWRDCLANTTRESGDNSRGSAASR